DRVTALRCGLDVDAWRGQRCSCLLNVNYATADLIRGKLPPFDLARAYELYRMLFGQVEDLIKGKHILAVPSGPLTTLPLQLLVPEPPASSAYAKAAWLGTRQPITVLPSAASLQSLRSFARLSHAADPFVGFGDPLLEGNPSVDWVAARAAQAREKQHCSDHVQSLASLQPTDGGARAIAVGANGVVDADFLRRQMPLPETADELCAVAHDFGVDPATHVYLGARATEATIKRLSHDGNLAQYRIVHFATHGAIAGEFSGTSEP